MNINHKTQEQNRQGMAIVEMALVLPLFMMLVLGIVEFGRAMMVSNLITDAAREGARLAASSDSTNSEVIALVQSSLLETVGVDPGNVSISLTVDPGPNNADPNDNLSLAQKRDICRVEVSVPFSKVSFIPRNHLGEKSLTGKSVMRHE